MKKTESGDSEELQALFDSIVGAAAPKGEEEPPQEGDSEELQALFDAVAAEFSEAASATGSGVSGEEGDVLTREQRDELYRRIGQVARKLHEALKELGCESVVVEAAEKVPDARQRLQYIAQKTEEAATKVLNACDIAQPLQKELAEKAHGLKEQWDRLFANRLSASEFKSLARETHAFLMTAEENANLTAQQLMQIIMAQDFQDLTGQVIKKVITIVGRIETELLRILIEAMPEEIRRQKVAEESLMNGPAIDPKAEGVVASQEEVDELLSSLGF
ncbi:MAG: protein phosphatase CheZ [Hydrogenophilus sp.]|nr:protein phosphatase CheZ [Hydrogenophilus sp.]